MKRIFTYLAVLFAAAAVSSILYRQFQALYTDYALLLYYAFFLLAAAALTALIHYKNIPRKWILVILAAFTVLICGGFALTHRLVYENDLQYYADTAKEILAGNKLPMYNAVFPQTVNYPAFLSVFYRVSGTGDFAPVALNICAGALTVPLIFLYASSSEFLSGFSNAKAAACAFAAALSPYLWIYADTPNAEIIFGAFVLAALYVYARSYANNSGGRGSGLLPLLAVILSMAANFSRPLGIICALAILIHFAVYVKRSRARKAALIAASALVILSFGQIDKALVHSLTGYQYPAHSYGWNLYVGASETGKWNAADSKELTRAVHELSTPTEVQSRFAQEAVGRYRAMGRGVIAHMIMKMSVWGPSVYLENVGNVNKHAGTAYDFCIEVIAFVYDTVIIMLAALGLLCRTAYLAFKGRALPPLYLYAFGAFLAFAIVEIAPRYTVSYRLLFCIMAFEFLFVASRFIKTHLSTAE